MAAAKKKTEEIEPVYVTVNPDESPDRVNGLTGVDPDHSASIYNDEEEWDNSAAPEDPKKEEPKEPATPTTPPPTP